jgi:hypothetical protein
LLLDLLTDQLKELVQERLTLEDGYCILSLSPWEAFQINSTLMSSPSIRSRIERRQSEIAATGVDIREATRIAIEEEKHQRPMLMELHKRILEVEIAEQESKRGPV